MIEVEWIAVRSIGDDGWGMSATGAVRLPGAAVSQVIERLRERLERDESRRGFDELYAHPNAKWLVKHPEVVQSAAALFRGHAVAARHLSLSVSRMPRDYRGGPLLGHWRVNTWLHLADVDDAVPLVVALLRGDKPDTGEIALPAIASSANDTALLRQGARLDVMGSDGPYVRIRPVALWPEADVPHVKALLTQLALAAGA